MAKVSCADCAIREKELRKKVVKSIKIIYMILGALLTIGLFVGFNIGTTFFNAEINEQAAIIGSAGVLGVLGLVSFLIMWLATYSLRNNVEKKKIVKELGFW